MTGGLEKLTMVMVDTSTANDNDYIEGNVDLSCIYLIFMTTFKPCKRKINETGTYSKSGVFMERIQVMSSI